MNKDRQVKVYDMIPDDVRSRLEPIDLEDDEQSGAVDVYDIVSDDICAQLGVFDLE